MHKLCVILTIELRMIHNPGWMQIEPIYKQIGGNVRSRRRNLDWTQERLAAMLRISRGALANIESGRQRIFIHQLLAIADAMGISLTDMLPNSIKGTSAPDFDSLPIPNELSQQQKSQIAQIINASHWQNKTDEKV